VTQQEMQAVACPNCGQPVGWPCHRGGRERATVCVKRKGAAEMMIGWKAGGPTMADRLRMHQHRWRTP
jgi:hypothetical protein